MLEFVHANSSFDNGVYGLKNWKRERESLCKNDPVYYDKYLALVLIY